MAAMRLAGLLLALAGSLGAQLAPEAAATGLGGTSWRLVRFAGSDDTSLVPDDRAKYTIEFGSDGRVSVRIDCNRGNGVWKSPEPNRLELGPLALTRAKCPPALLTDRMPKHWGLVRSYTIRNGHLFLSLMADGGIYEFEPMKLEGKKPEERSPDASSSPAIESGHAAGGFLRAAGILSLSGVLPGAGVAGKTDYSIEAIRYGTIAAFPVASLVMGAPKDEKTDIAMVVWLIRRGGRNILFDSGFHRESWLKQFPTADYLRPDEAVEAAGVKPEDVTDIVISHAHWDHMGGIDLFPKATVWIQKQEFAYYTGEAWQPGGKHGGIDKEDVRELVRLNTEGRLRLVDGDGVEVLPGIRAYTGARHTFASQYIRVDGVEPFVLASDNCYLYRNLAEHKASATFSESDQPANIRNQSRMIELAGSADRVVPGHDPAQFTRFPSTGRVARIR